MPEFTPEELNLIYLYNPGNLRGLLYELRSMQCVLMPDEKSPETLRENNPQGGDINKGSIQRTMRVMVAGRLSSWF